MPATSNARSNLNALTHGLCAALPINPEEFTAMSQAIQEWTDEYGCTSPVETSLIKSAAAASVRHSRCLRAEEAAMRISHAEAQQRWIGKRRQRVRKLAQSLSTNPTETIELLESSSYGCEWLISHWKSIDAVLAQGLSLNHDQQVQAMQLAGYFGQTPGPDAATDARQLWAMLLVAVPHALRVGPTATDANRRFLESFDPASGIPTDAINARAYLRAFIGAEIEHLQALRNDHFAATDGPELAAIADLGLIDTSDEGKLRHRYRVEAERSQKSNLAHVWRIRESQRRE
jgi:hypothetical protein